MNTVSLAFFELETKESDRPGVHFTDTLIAITGEMKDRWLPNDMFWPSILLDNSARTSKWANWKWSGTAPASCATTSAVCAPRTTSTKRRTKPIPLFSNDPAKWIWPQHGKQMGRRPPGAGYLPRQSGKRQEQVLSPCGQPGGVAGPIHQPSGRCNHAIKQHPQRHGWRNA